MSLPSPSIIGIDIRKLADFGIGTYIQNLLDGLFGLSQKQEIVFRLYVENHFVPSCQTMTSDRFPVVKMPAGRRSPFQGKLPKTQDLAAFHAPHYLTPDCKSVKLILTVHDCIHVDPPPKPDGITPLGNFYDRLFDSSKRFYHLFQGHTKFQRLVEKATEIITVSQATAAKLVELTGVSSEKITTIHNCLNAVYFQDSSPENKQAFCKKLNLPMHDYILYCGNDLYHKNLAGLLTAWACLCKMEKPPLLVLAGPPRRKMITTYAQSLGINEKIRFIGHLSPFEMPLLYRCASGLVFPSLAEGFGLPVIEAMACSIPVACSNLTVLREISGGHASFFNPTNIREMADVISAIIRKTPDVNNNVTNARMTSKRYSFDSFVTGHLDVYNRVLEDFL